MFKSLVRNLAKNMDNLFETRYRNVVMGSHPTFQDRVKAIKAQLSDEVVKIEKI